MQVLTLIKQAVIVVAMLTLSSKTVIANENIDMLKVKGTFLTEPMAFKVTLPDGYHDDKNKDKKYYLFFDMHPRTQPLFSGMQDWLSHNGEWPWFESIIVTPNAYNSEFAALFEQLSENPKSPAMLDFFENELLSALDEKYRTNGFRIYSGFMSNGAFGLYALLNRPELFNAYFIASPSIGNDFLSVTLDADKKLQKLDDNIRFLYMVTGKHRYEQGNLAAFESFSASLKNKAPKSLQWQVDNNNQNYYMSRPVFTVMNGIELLFDDIHTNLAADSEISQQGSQAIIDYYAMLSKRKYGFEVSAEGSLKAYAESLKTTAPQKALAIYQKTAQLYPDSAYALSSLSESLEENSDFEGALRTQMLAVEKSKAMIPWHQNNQKKKLEALEKRIAAQKVK